MPAAVRHVSSDERGHRLAARLHLAAPGNGVEQVSEALVGYHATDPATVYLSALARHPGLILADMEDALYGRRTLLKILGMRRTMFVVPTDLGSVVDAACTRIVSSREHRRLEQVLAANGIADPGRWIAEASEQVLDDLRRHGPATARELAERVPEVDFTIRMGTGKWETDVAVTTRLLFLLAGDSAVIRARPLGTWLSSQYRWAATDTWSPQLLRPMEPREAQADLVRRWLLAYGPGTTTDLAWWSGLTRTAVRAALTTVGAVEVSLDGDGTGWLAPDDVDTASAAPRPWAALLPALDATVMAWKERDWYLPPEMVPHLFDTNGNAGPTVWVSGRVVGGWGQRADGTVEVRLLEDVDSGAADLLDAETHRTEQWLDGTVVTPRFRTPLERAIATPP